MEKIQIFLKNIQVATSNNEQFITFQPTKITLPNKDLLYETQHVQQKLECIKELNYKMNNYYVIKTVNHKQIHSNFNTMKQDFILNKI